MSKVNRTRRDFLKTVSLGAAAMAAPGCLQISKEPTQANKRKPNLLFIWTDEQRADTMAVYGNTKIHAPNLNKLAAQSVVFERAYVTQPVCTPNRAAVMTGLWPHMSGCLKNNIPLSADTPCLPEIINDPDYRTAYMGKWHLGDEIFAQHGFDEWVSMEDGYSSYYSAGRDRNERSDYHHFLIEHGYQPDSNGKFSRAFAARRPIEHCKPKFLELRACDFLHRHRDEPFMLYINFLEPHMPFFGPLDNEHDPEQVDLPANFSDPLEENEPLRYRVKRESCMEKYGKDEKSIRNLIAKYWGLITQVDRSVGAILDTLENHGLADNTIVVYTSDHGDMMGSHNMVEKSVMYEEAVRIPWLMRIPWFDTRQRVIPNTVSQIDMVPTLLDLLGHSRDKRFPGRSLVPLIKTGRPVRDHVYIQWNPNSGAISVKKGGTKLAGKEQLKHVENESSRAVISSDGWKLCLSDLDKCQLFNLADDPGETTNLYDSGRYKDVVVRLTKKIHQWQETVADKANV